MSGTRGGSNDAALPLIATEEIGGEQYQKIKIVNGAAGQTAAIGGDATNGLDVDVTRVSGTVTVGATDLDIRALDSGTDSVSVTGSVSASVTGTVTADAGTGPWAVTDNDGSITVDGAVTVDATALDIRALTQASDSVAIGDGTTILPVLDVGEGEYGIRVVVFPGATPIAVSNALGLPLAIKGTENQNMTFSGDSFPPLGGRGMAAVPSAVTDGRGVLAYFDLTGHQHVKVDRAPICGTGTNSTVAASATSVTILAANANRLGATIFNDSTVALYIDLSGGTATTSSFTAKIAADGYYEVPFGYTGTITGLWASATGNARVTQMTA